MTRTRIAQIGDLPLKLGGMLPKAVAAGVKLCTGDDFGTAVSPHGEYGNELAVYVEHADIAPLEVIRPSTNDAYLDHGHACGSELGGEFLRAGGTRGEQRHIETRGVGDGGVFHHDVGALPLQSGARTAR